MSSEFLTRKLKRGFDCFDTDHNGVVELGDFSEAGNRVSIAFGVAPSSPQGSAMREAWETMWLGLFGPMDRDNDGKVTFEEFNAGLSSQVADEAGGYERFLSQCVDRIVDVVDRDGDGRLSAEEFGTLYAAMLGLSAEETAAAFARLDTDADGALTRAELHTAISQYWGGDDETADGNWLLGPIN